MSQIQAALAELDKMTRVLKAFEGARVVFDALANAEQVEKELAARNSALAVTADELVAKVKVAQDAARDAEVRAAQVVKGAEQAAAAVAADAEATAKEIIDGALKQKADVDALAEQSAKVVSALREEIAGLETTKAAVQADLDKLNDAVKAVREKFGAV